MNKNELDALISLLDDSDPEIFSHIGDRLITLGKEVIPVLEDAWSKSFDGVVQQRIENIIHKIQFDTLKIDLKKWSVENSDDLLAGAMLISRYQYPDVDENKIREQLNKIKRDAWVELGSSIKPLEKINALNHVFFDVHGFNGNTSNFHAPQNSFINTVLETKKGNPLMLCVIYCIIARQLDIPLSGVNLPEHFILAYIEENETRLPENTNSGNGVLFYINAFNRGTIFSRKDIDQFLKKLNIKPSKFYYEPCSNLEIIQRSLRNLVFSYQKLNETEKLTEVGELLEYLNL